MRYLLPHIHPWFSALLAFLLLPSAAYRHFSFYRAISGASLEVYPSLDRTCREHLAKYHLFCGGRSEGSSIYQLCSLAGLHADGDRFDLAGHFIDSMDEQPLPTDGLWRLTVSSIR